MDDLLVSYDVASDKRRRKLFKLLHRWGAPLQKSVFRCRVRDTGFARMRRAISRPTACCTSSSAAAVWSG